MDSSPSHLRLIQLHYQIPPSSGQKPRCHHLVFAFFLTQPWSFSIFIHFASEICLVSFYFSPVPPGSLLPSFSMFPVAFEWIPPLALLLHSGAGPHTFYWCKSDHVTSLFKTLQCLLIPHRINSKLIKLHMIWLMICSSTPFHVPLSPAEMWKARENSRLSVP